MFFKEVTHLKYKLVILLILVVSLLSVSAVSAADNVTDDIVSVDDATDEIQAVENVDWVNTEINNDTGTFDDLSSEINAVGEGGVLNLSKDYKFVKGSSDGIVINKTITINGNNHKIDGNNKSRIFLTFDGNITLNNLILVNGHADKGGAIFVNKTITCNNVIFENNYANEGGAIYTKSNVTLDSCVFNGGYAEKGAAIYAGMIPQRESATYGPGDDSDFDFNESDVDYNESDSDYNESDEYPIDFDFGEEKTKDKDTNPEVINVTYNCKITNSIFKNFNNIRLALIYLDYFQKLEVSNSTFANSTSQYATVCYDAYNSNQNHVNNTYVNLHASKSAGAFRVGEISTLYVGDSSFDNVTSYYNGGVFVVDGQCWDLGGTAQVVINNTEIKNSKSKYGSVLTFYAGNLYIINSTLIDNEAESNGLIYVCDADAKITNSTFKNNKINSADDSQVDRAIIYAFSTREIFIIDNVEFINNSNVLFACKAEYKIINNNFYNNGRAIYSILPISSYLDKNNFNNDAVVENASADTYYVTIINSTGVSLNLTGNIINVSSLPARYDSRDWGWVTPVKDQWISGACWVFSTCAALESALLKSTGVEYNLSIQNIQKNLLQYLRYGDTKLSEPGFTFIAAEYILSWYAALPAEYDEFDMIGKITEPIISNDAVHIQDVVWISPRDNITDNDKIKWAIIKYGAVTGDMLADYDSIYFNRNTSAAYCNLTVETHSNHAVCIVGWDDDYPAGNFRITPPGNGAWIIKNSYGNESFDNGYVYISYYDTVFLNETQGVAFIIENTENYNKNYQTDISGYVSAINKSKNYSFKNSYKAIGDDFISAVGTYFNYLGEDYTVEIYVNGALKHTQRGTAPFRGFHTIKLTKNIPIKTGDIFTIVMKTHSVFLVNETMMPLSRNVSFVDDGSGWKDVRLDNYTVCLKAYTKPLVNLTTTIKAANVNTVYNGGKYLTVTVKDVYGDALKGVYVTIKLSNGDTKTSKTDSKGQVKFSTNGLAPKTYTATITTKAFANYLKTTSTAKIVVKKANPKLTASKKTFKKSVKTKRYTVILKTNKNKVMKNKWVTLKVNKKTYKAKTNSKGRATFKITNLKKKGTFKAIVKFAGNSYYNSKTVNTKIRIR